MQKSRVEKIIDEILSGEFTENELEDIMDACEDELSRIEEEEEKERAEEEDR